MANLHWCDGIQHCIDGSDELCHSDDCVGFLCHDTCIPARWQNDDITDCMYSEDETHYTDLSFSPKTCKTADNYLPCVANSVQHCYPASHHCLYETEHTGDISFCRRGTHLKDCADFVCSSTYKCPRAYCIPFGRICDGNIDCPDGEDEWSCHGLVHLSTFCQGLFYCKKENICLSSYQVCNGKIDCHLSGDDEKYCANKTSHFEYLKMDTQENITKGIILVFDNRLSSSLQAIDCSKLGIRTLENKLAPYQQLNMKLVDISRNQLIEIPSLIFWSFQQVRYLFLNKNKITTIDAFAFKGLKNMFYLDLSDNSLSAFSSNMFDRSIISNLDVAKNPLTNVESGFFSKVQIRTMLIPATNIMCCMLADGSISTSCKGNEDRGICKDLLVSNALGYLIWLMCLIVITAALVLFLQTTQCQSQPYAFLQKAQVREHLGRVTESSCGSMSCDTTVSRCFRRTTLLT